MTQHKRVGKVHSLQNSRETTPQLNFLKVIEEADKRTIFSLFSDESGQRSLTAHAKNYDEGDPAWTDHRSSMSKSLLPKKATNSQN